MEFSASLYEARWREVVRFLEAASPLLPVLGATWDPSRFLKNVDSGKSEGRKSQARAQEDEERKRGLTQFDAHMLRADLRSGLFSHYFHMCLLLDSVPPMLSSWAESCVCHEPLVAGLSQHSHDALMQLHYGQGVRPCPMAGMLAPELIAGRLDDIQTTAWSNTEAELHTLPLLPKAHQLTPADWEIVLNEFHVGQSTVNGLLEAKSGLWRRLPWKLCVLAHTQEEVARSFAAECVQEFDVDPRKESHHRVTWLWLSPAGFRRPEIDKFLAGTPRSCLDFDTQKEIAALRFVSTVEASIEGRHARVAVAHRCHAVGPVKVSLANRLPMLEQCIVKKHICPVDLIECFGKARSLRVGARMLNLHTHPAVLRAVAEGRSTSGYHTQLTKALYNCSLEDTIFKHYEVRLFENII